MIKYMNLVNHINNNINNFFKIINKKINYPLYLLISFDNDEYLLFQITAIAIIII